MGTTLIIFIHNIDKNIRGSLKNSINISIDDRVKAYPPSIVSVGDMIDSVSTHIDNELSNIGTFQLFTREYFYNSYATRNILEKGAIVKIIKKGEYKNLEGVVVELQDDGKSKIDIYDKCSKIISGYIIENKYLEVAINRRNSIFYTNYKIKDEGTHIDLLLDDTGTEEDNQLISLPGIIKYVDTEKVLGKEIFRIVKNIRIPKNLTRSADLNYELSSSISIDIKKYTLKDSDIKPPPIGVYNTNTGYTSIMGNCRDNIIKWSSGENILNIISDCFFYLTTGPEQQNKKGNKCKQSNKNLTKVPTVNKLIGFTDEKPFTNIKFLKYVDKQNMTLLLGDQKAYLDCSGMSEPIIKKYMNLLKHIQLLNTKDGVLVKDKKGTSFGFYIGSNNFSKIVKGDDLTLEIQLILRYFRYINKGVLYNIYTKWYIRKGEMYAWLGDMNKPLNNIIVESEGCGS